LEKLFGRLGVTIVGINKNKVDETYLIKDFISIITSYYKIIWYEKKKK